MFVHVMFVDRVHVVIVVVVVLRVVAVTPSGRRSSCCCCCCSCCGCVWSWLLFSAIAAIVNVFATIHIIAAHICGEHKTTMKRNEANEDTVVVVVVVLLPLELFVSSSRWWVRRRGGGGGGGGGGLRLGGSCPILSGLSFIYDQEPRRVDEMTCRR